MPTTVFPTVAPFDGDEGRFAVFLSTIDTAARRCCRYGPHVLYANASDDERTEMVDNGEIDLDVHVLTEPDLPVNAEDPNQELEYKSRIRKWQIFEEALHEFNTWFFSLMTTAVMNHVTNFRQVDFANLPVRDMRAHLIATYGHSSQATSRAKLNLLAAPFTAGDDLPAHIQKFDEVFDYFDRINDPISDLFKYEHLVRSMATHEDYSKYITQYEISGTKTYGALTRALLSYRSELATANAVRQMHQVTTSRTAAAASGSNILDGYQIMRPDKYCWTHGLTFHDGKECRKKGKGHKADADKDHRMGGSKAVAIPRLVPA